MRTGRPAGRLEIGQGGKGRQEAWFVFAEPIAMPPSKMTIKLRHDVNKNYLIGRFQLTVTDQVPAFHPNPERSKQVRRLPPSRPRNGRRTRRSSRPDVRGDGLSAADRHAGSGPADAEARQRDRRDGDALKTAKPRDTYIHLRGDFLNPDKATGKLEPGTPAALPPLGPWGRRAGSTSRGGWSGPTTRSRRG